MYRYEKVRISIKRVYKRWSSLVNSCKVVLETIIQATRYMNLFFFLVFANRLRRVVVKNLRVSKLVRAPSRRERLSCRFSLVFHGLFVDQSLILTSVDPKRRCRPSSDLDHPNIARSNCPITRIKYVCVIVGGVILRVVKFASVSL